MSPYQTARSGRPANPSAPAHHAPHAALLIDFDNVTLGIRSDLTKELRTLLNSAMIKGKVAVQRAYADWRRYPQYIVPLSESSIDLIFAPAFGTTKKNATDIRLAIDAIELVFTRPEIGTVILLSGDSDFSSLVIKLKEYGKYVIGVGIRESASDLLIQNCDEYYSYSDLAGLTKEEEPSSIQRDPWELVVQAAEQMARNKDVMRSDRLKQVMQQIDPNFDEKNAGFNRFSKFVAEAGNRGLIAVTKLDNGQFEVAPPRAAARPASEAPITVPTEDGRGRGRGRGRRGRGGREREAVPAAEAPPAAKGPKATGRLTLSEAFHLMQRGLGELPAPVAHDKLRARMVALLGREDSLLEASHFPRLLRQANDAEVADVRKTGDDGYEVSLHRATVIAKAAEAAGQGTRVAARGGEAPAPLVEGETQPADVDAGLPGESAAERARRLAGGRFRRGSRGGVRMADVPLVGVVKMEPEPGAVPEPGKTTKAAKKKRARKAKAGPAPKAEAATPAPSAPKEEARPAAVKKKRHHRARKPKAREAPPE